MPDLSSKERSVDGVNITPKTIHKNSTDAMQGEKTGRVRYILAISFLLAVVALAGAYFIALPGHN